MSSRDSKSPLIREIFQLPNNGSHVFRKNLLIPSSEVWNRTESVIERAAPLPKREFSLFGGLKQEGSSDELMIDCAVLDLSIDFMRACTYFRKHELVVPSKFVQFFLSNWFEDDNESSMERAIARY